MSAIDELQSAITAVAEQRRPVRRRHRVAPARVRRRPRRRQGPDQRPQRPRRRGHRHLRRRPLDSRPASPGSTSTATWRSSTSTPAGAKALDWADGRRSTWAPSCSAPRRRPVAAPASPSAPCRRSRARSAARAAAASPAASSTPRRSPPARPAAPLVDATGRLLGLNTNRLGEGFYLALPADAALRERVDALGRGESRQPAAARRRRRAVARRPAASAGRSACRSATACSSAASRTAARPARPASRQGDLIVEVAGKAIDGRRRAASRRSPAATTPSRSRSSAAPKSGRSASAAPRRPARPDRWSRKAQGSTRPRRAGRGR